MGAERPDPGIRADLAHLAAAVERWAVDLALSEEPAAFLAVLEQGAPEPEA